MRFLKYFTIISVICLLTYCSRKVQKPDPIQIVTSADYEPLSYRTKDEELIGFEIELIKEVMRRLNKTYVIEELSFHEIFCSIEGRRADVAISSITKTKDREDKFDFTIPYLNSPQSIVLSVDNAATHLDDLHPKKILIQKSASYPTLLKQILSRYPNTPIVEIKSMNKILEEFKKDFKKNVIILLDQSMVKNLFQNNTTLKVKTINFQDEDLNFSIMLPKGSKLKTPINKIIKELETDGTLQALKQKYNL